MKCEVEKGFPLLALQDMEMEFVSYASFCFLSVMFLERPYHHGQTVEH